MDFAVHNEDTHIEFRALYMDENFIFCVMSYCKEIDVVDEETVEEIFVWRKNSLPQLVALFYICSEGFPVNYGYIQQMTSDENELVVKTSRQYLILFNMETADQKWVKPWDLHTDYQINSNKINKQIHIWRINEFWNHDHYRRAYYSHYSQYSQFQLIRLIFEQEL